MSKNITSLLILFSSLLLVSCANLKQIGGITENSDPSHSTTGLYIQSELDQGHM